MHYVTVTVDSMVLTVVAVLKHSYLPNDRQMQSSFDIHKHSRHVVALPSHLSAAQL